MAYVQLCHNGSAPAALGRSFDIPFQMPWLALLCVVAGVLAIVGLTMLYASAKLKKGNMIDTLKNENI